MKPLFSLLAAGLLLATSAAQAGPLADRLRERLQSRQQSEAAPSDLAELGGDANAQSCADWARRVARLQRFATAGPKPDVADLAYGPAPLEKLDVFLPKRTGSAAPAPIILMVHGGGWCVGDKGGATMTANKVARWVTRGFVFISINYPMINEGRNALAQAHHVAAAAAFVQARAREWGGDPDRLILMGHSAGAHLVSLVNADAEIRAAHGLRPLLGTVSLDAGAIDVVTQMPNVYPFLKTRYREAFGTTEAEWITASPFHKLDRTASPWLGVCSTTRKDDPCGQAHAYAAKSQALGIRAEVLPEPMNHGAINKELGQAGAYTDSVERFLRTLDPVVAGLLDR